MNIMVRNHKIINGKIGTRIMYHTFFISIVLIRCE